MEEGMKWKKEIGGVRLNRLAEISWTRREDFDDLWTKLEEWKKNVIGGPKWQFEFC